MQDEGGLAPGSIRRFFWERASPMWSTTPMGVVRNGLSSTLGDYRYKGRRFDPETGFYYFRHRYYRPDWGRFITGDPLGSWADGNNHGNIYSFVGSSPTVWGDPSGLVSIRQDPDKKGGKPGEGGVWPDGSVTIESLEWIDAKSADDFRGPVPEPLPPHPVTGDVSTAATRSGVLRTSETATKMMCAEVAPELCANSHGPDCSRGGCNKCWDCRIGGVIRATAVFYPASSWLSNPAALAHERGHLMVALYVALLYDGMNFHGEARSCSRLDAAQKAMAMYKSRSAEILREVWDTFQIMQRKYDQETNGGKDRDKQKELDEWLRGQL